MRLVVADTGPLHYLVLIGHAELLPELFQRVTVPDAVWRELRHPEAPAVVRRFAARPPSWIEVRPAPRTDGDPKWRVLDPGERAALALAKALAADLILMDDRAAVRVAREQGFAVTGTLGILDLAAQRGLVQHHTAIEALKATNFRYRPEIMDALLARHQASR